MKMPDPLEALKKAKLPVMYGGILLMFYIAFTNRRKFMTDLDSKRAELMKENSSEEILLRESIKKLWK